MTKTLADGPPKTQIGNLSSKVLVSPRTYLHAKERVTKQRKTVEQLYGPNQQVIFFD